MSAVSVHCGGSDYAPSVRMICSAPACPLPGLLHTDCRDRLEELIVRRIKLDKTRKHRNNKAKLVSSLTLNFNLILRL